MGDKNYMAARQRIPDQVGDVTLASLRTGYRAGESTEARSPAEQIQRAEHGAGDEQADVRSRQRNGAGSSRERANRRADRALPQQLFQNVVAIGLGLPVPVTASRLQNCYLLRRNAALN